MSNINLAGSRYVFFKTLPKDSPMRARGESALNNIRQALSPNNLENKALDQHFDNILKYINFVKEMADSAQHNEINFLNQQLTALNKLDGENNELREWLENFKSGSVDYDKMFLIFNGLLQNAQTDQAILNRVRLDATAVTSNFRQFSKVLQDFLKQAYDENMEQYKAVLHKEESKLAQNYMKEYKKSFSNIFAKKINTILKQITSYPQFKQILIDTYNNSKNLEISDEQFKRIVVNYVIDYFLEKGVTDEIDTNGITKEIISNIEQSFSSIAQNYGDKDYIYAFDRIGKSLEEIALTEKGSVGAFVTSLDKNSIIRIRNKYSKYDKSLKDDLNKLLIYIEDADKYASKIRDIQPSITRKLKAKIKEKYHINQPISSSQFSAQFKDIITPTRSRQSILENIQGVSISHEALAEAIGAQDVQQRLIKILTGKITGDTIKFKADIRFSTGYISDGSSVFDEEKVETIIDNTVKKYSDFFFLRYQEKSHGTTDVGLAMEAYQDWIQEMQEYIKKIVYLDQNIQNKEEALLQIYREFEKTFSGSISVKDYDLYNNELGTHGGSLGSTKAPEQVMKNIYQMYSLGGITGLDVNKLMTATINCGSDMLGSDLKEPLETYLLGGAALIMFDDSFALSENFLNLMTTKLKGQSVVNIYRINTRYIPASYILYEIYNNLTSIYSSLESEQKTSTQHNKVHIANNISSQIVYSYSEMSVEERWTAIRDYAEEHILIRFSFMGGLLDILNRLPTAFSI